MGVRWRDCGRESRLEPQCLERPSTPLIQLLFSCKSYQHFLLTPTITPHSWALFSLFTAHQGEGRHRRQRDGAEEGREKWNILAPDFNWQNASALSQLAPRTLNSFPSRLLMRELIIACSCDWLLFDCCNIHPAAEATLVLRCTTLCLWLYLHTNTVPVAEVVTFVGGEAFSLTCPFLSPAANRAWKAHYRKPRGETLVQEFICRGNRTFQHRFDTFAAVIIAVRTMSEAQTISWNTKVTKVL